MNSTKNKLSPIVRRNNNTGNDNDVADTSKHEDTYSYKTTNFSDTLYSKSYKSNTLQPVSAEIKPQWQNSLRKNRKNNFNTRSVWYAESEADEKPSAGFALRKASSLDSILTNKKPNALKITKDMISAPLFPRKITGQWNSIAEKEVEENFDSGSDSDSLFDGHQDNEIVNEENTINLLCNQKFRVKITKDMISSPIFARKMTNQMNSISENNNVVEEDNSGGDISQKGTKDELKMTADSKLSPIVPKNIPDDCNIIGNDNVVADSCRSNENKSEERADNNNAENENSYLDEREGEKTVESQPVEDENLNLNEVTRYKDNKDCIIDYNKRKNILHHADIILSSKFNTNIDITQNNTLNNPNIKSEDLLNAEKNIEEDNNQDGTQSDIKSLGVESNVHNLEPNKIFIYKEANMTFPPIANNPVKYTTLEKNVEKYEKLKKNKRKEKKKESGSNLIKMKFLSKSIDVISFSNGKIDDEEEVLRTLQTNKDEPLSRNVGPFPKTDEHFITDDVQLRAHRNDSRLRQSKTLDCDPRRHYRNHSFEVKGCTKINLPDNVPIKLKKNEYIQYQNSSLIKSDETNSVVLKFGVIIKSARLTNKREVELRDVNNQIYLLVFDSSKDAKLFIESEKVSCYTDSEKSTITKTLLRLLGKRSSREVLEKKGIYQNEPIFGNTLKNIYNVENGVPKFIIKTMELIELPDNITSLGLYRTSGNLATIQKIRLEVDKGNLDILEMYAKDPDVLTGSLKLFFRELKEPLLSCKTCDNLLEFTKNDKNYCKKDRENIRTILSHIPESNAETLLALIRHLIEVVKYKDQNKMDTYNLAVCWGPTIIFATDNLGTNDLVTQSAEATKLFDALLNFYINNPEELDFRKKKPDYFDSNRNMIHRQDSKDSIQSSDSGNSSHKNKSSSNLSLDAIDEVLKKSVDLIEAHLDTEGIYKKAGSYEKVNKILRKMSKRKLTDLDKYRNDTYDMSDSLKRYLKEGCDPLVTKETVEHVNKICDNTQWLEHNTRQKVMTILMDVPKKDTFIFLVRHIIKLIKYESSNNVPKSEMILIWSRVLNDQMKIIESEEKMINFLRILVDVLDDTKSDVSVKPKGMSNGLLNDLKNLQKEKDRISKYDNVPDESEYFNKEATIMEEKTEETEQTKL